MRKLICTIIVVFFTAASARSATVTFTGALVDRQCSVADALAAQPQSDRRCTLWVKDAAGRVATAWCPNKMTVSGVTYSSFVTCSDPYAAQWGRQVTITGNLRSIAEAGDGFGQIIVICLSYQ